MSHIAPTTTDMLDVSSAREVKNSAAKSRALQYAGGAEVWIADYSVRFQDGHRLRVSAKDKHQAILFAQRQRQWDLTLAGHKAKAEGQAHTIPLRQYLKLAKHENDPASASAEHRSLVERALNEGRHVPDLVLLDYPHLIGKAIQVAQENCA